MLTLEEAVGRASGASLYHFYNSSENLKLVEDEKFEERKIEKV